MSATVGSHGEEVVSIPEGQTMREALAERYAQGPKGLWLILVPAMDHALTSDGGGDPRCARIVPDMPDDDRRDVANRLRAGTIDLLYFTPERLEQERFTTFLKGLGPRQIVVASSEDSSNHIQILQHHFPGLPVILWSVMPAPPAAPPQSSTVNTPSAPTSAPSIPSPPKTITSRAQDLEGWEEAIPHFDAESDLDSIGQQLGRDQSWCWRALCHYLERTGRTKPFPWIAQGAYVSIAMVAGQAESNDPRVVQSIVGKQYPPEQVRAVLVILNNRARQAPESSRGRNTP